ncbi:hypothetical protein [Ideonella oryzae]|uniref:Uncharacterized protein n=1 Tax=Ideonella oryzae TaxID=2937441 RepID=A0ABT1BKQ5_9BURK|nr:hypothetical protein [Ideonella oryzae]MCO5976791.1 hypothetical protein [Ideonella oryzae]
MHYTTERLMNGDTSVLDSFVVAKRRWEGLFKDLETVDPSDLAERISTEQHWFEHHCGGRWPGQEVMAVTAFAAIFSVRDGWDGKEHLGEKIAQAFADSSCSGEVKAAARKAAKSYWLES